MNRVKRNQESNTLNHAQINLFEQATKNIPSTTKTYETLFGKYVHSGIEASGLLNEHMENQPAVVSTATHKQYRPRARKPIETHADILSIMPETAHLVPTRMTTANQWENVIKNVA